MPTLTRRKTGAGEDPKMAVTWVGDGVEGVEGGRGEPDHWWHYPSMCGQFHFKRARRDDPPQHPRSPQPPRRGSWPTTKGMGSGPPRGSFPGPRGSFSGPRGVGPGARGVGPRDDRRQVAAHRRKDRLSKENEAAAWRLRNTKSYYSVESLKQEFAQHQIYLANLKKFCPAKTQKTFNSRTRKTGAGAGAISSRTTPRRSGPFADSQVKNGQARMAGRKEGNLTGRMDGRPTGRIERQQARRTEGRAVERMQRKPGGRKAGRVEGRKTGGGRKKSSYFQDLLQLVYSDDFDSESESSSNSKSISEHIDSVTTSDSSPSNLIEDASLPANSDPSVKSTATDSDVTKLGDPRSERSARNSRGNCSSRNSSKSKRSRRSRRTSSKTSRKSWLRRNKSTTRSSSTPGSSSSSSSGGSSRSSSGSTIRNKESRSRSRSNDTIGRRRRSRRHKRSSMRSSSSSSSTLSDSSSSSSNNSTSSCSSSSSSNSSSDNSSSSSRGNVTRRSMITSRSIGKTRCSSKSSIGRGSQRHTARRDDELEGTGDKNSRTEKDARKGANAEVKDQTVTDVLDENANAVKGRDDTDRHRDTDRRTDGGQDSYRGERTYDVTEARERRSERRDGREDCRDRQDRRRKERKKYRGRHARGKSSKDRSPSPSPSSSPTPSQAMEEDIRVLLDQTRVGMTSEGTLLHTLAVMTHTQRVALLHRWDSQEGADLRRELKSLCSNESGLLLDALLDDRRSVLLESLRTPTDVKARRLNAGMDGTSRLFFQTLVMSSDLDMEEVRRVYLDQYNVDLLCDLLRTCKHPSRPILASLATKTPTTSTEALRKLSLENPPSRELLRQREQRRQRQELRAKRLRERQQMAAEEARGGAAAGRGGGGVGGGKGAGEGGRRAGVGGSRGAGRGVGREVEMTRGRVRVETGRRTQQQQQQQQQRQPSWSTEDKVPRAISLLSQQSRGSRIPRLLHRRQQKQEQEEELERRKQEEEEDLILQKLQEEEEELKRQIEQESHRRRPTEREQSPSEGDSALTFPPVSKAKRVPDLVLLPTVFCETDVAE